MANYKSIDAYVKDFIKELKAYPGKVFTDAFLNEVASDAVKAIRTRTRLGKGVSSATDDPTVVQETKLNEVSDKYAARRRLNKSKHPLAPKTGKKSNLTLTGQLLDSIVYEILRGKGIRISIPRTNRSEGSTNEDVARHVQENGREFFNLTAKEYKVLLTKIQRRIRTEFKNSFSKLGGENE